MTSKSYWDWDPDNPEGRLLKIQLPNFFKKIGIGIAISAFAFLILINEVYHYPQYSIVTKYILLIGLLIVSVSKDKIEDELIIKLRMQSYSSAFVLGVIYAIALPFVDYFFFMVENMEETSLFGNREFSILWWLLCTQVLIFEYLKHHHR